jgi:hypothetical protein
VRDEPRSANGEPIPKETDPTKRSLREIPEVDFSKAKRLPRGKYAEKARRSFAVAIVEPELPGGADGQGARSKTKKPGSATPAARLHVLLGRDAPRCAYCFSAPPGATRPEQVLPAWKPERVPPARRSAVTRGRRP